MNGKRGLMREHVEKTLGGRSLDEVAAGLAPDMADLPVVPAGTARVSNARAAALWEAMGAEPGLREVLLGRAGDDLALYQGNIENAIGLLRLPVGVAGPLRVNGLAAKGDYRIPLATTEAALVASYHRGCRLLTAAGGCTAMVLNESVGRSPAFAFRSAAEACRFVVWALERFGDFQKMAAETTSHGEMIDMGCTVEGNHVHLHFAFTTGDAAGQNMVTLATQAVCDGIVAASPVKPVRHYVEGNMSGDKKASARTFTGARGKK